MQKGQKKAKTIIYQAPASYVAIFYGVLLFWTVGTVPLIIQKFQQGYFRYDWLFGFMIGFFYVFTWFWSLGLFYRIAIDAEGEIRMKSFRRVLETSAKAVNTIEGSRFSGGFGFIRFKLPLESAYLFCYRRNQDMDTILKEIRRLNPLVKTARI